MAGRYAREKLFVAMDCLAVSTEPLQQRLANAGLTALVRLTPDTFDDPDERAMFERIMRALSVERPAGTKGVIGRSAEALTDEGALAVARDIADLHGRVLPLS